MTAWHGGISWSNPNSIPNPLLQKAVWAGFALMMAARRVQRVHVSAHAMGGTAPPTMTPAQSIRAAASAPGCLSGVLTDRCAALRLEVAHGPSRAILSIAGGLGAHQCPLTDKSGLRPWI